MFWPLQCLILVHWPLVSLDCWAAGRLTLLGHLGHNIARRIENEIIHRAEMRLSECYGNAKIYVSSIALGEGDVGPPEPR